MTVHHLRPSPDTVTDVFDPSLPPVLTVAPGDSVVVRSLDASGYLVRQETPGQPQPTLIPRARGHCLTGPIAVLGAVPGTLLAVHFVSLTPDPWGWTAAAARDTPITRRLGLAGGPPGWLLWDVDPVGGAATDHLGHTVSTAPFLGVVGLPPTEPGAHSTIPPRSEGGGNIDCRELVAGTTLYLPVTVPDALLCLGDGHAAQGDGEVGGTAIECAMTTEVSLDIRAGGAAAPPGIHAVTPTARITFGFSADLNQATGDALDGMVIWMQSLFGLDKATALALASPTVDLRVTQVANTTWGVHALLRHDAIRHDAVRHDAAGDATS